MKTIMIAGGAGQFGSVLADAAAAREFRVITFDSMITGDGQRIKHGPLVKADLRETPRIVRSIREYAATHLFHCALIPEAATGPAELYDQHLSTTMSAIQAAKETGVPLTVLVPKGSTSAMLERIVEDCAAAMKIDFQVISWARGDALSGALARLG